MKQITIAIAFVCMMLSVQYADAQKFGYMNSAELLSEHPDVKVADSELETLQKQYSSRIQDKVTSLQGRYSELRQKEEQGLIPPKDLQEQVKKLQEQEQALVNEEQQLQNDLVQRRQQLYQPIVDKINDAIKAVASENNYQYIFDQAQGALLYVDESANVSALIKSKLGM